ncbi:formimidoylglutamase [Salinimonas lutimaris]|uniref:formimidoylglutamase n=1 Tax=Salinimonas lutimaris TaxID=914153 RepID=UPI001586397D|nr:formimidoylglutamase [Salinimonas lutimaris]
MSVKNHWQGRIDIDNGDTRRWHQVVQFWSDQHSKSAVGLLGYPTDDGVLANHGRGGAADGPQALRRAMANLPWCVSGSLTDYGDSHIAGSVYTNQKQYAERLSHCLTHSNVMLGLGGGHDIARASFLGLQDYLQQPKRVGLLNFDAHLDLRNPDNGATSGTPFYDIAQWCQHNNRLFHYACLGVSSAANTPALFARASTLHVTLLEDISYTPAAASSLLTAWLSGLDELYVTVCMDVFNGSEAPGVSAPAAVGVAAKDIIQTIRWLGTFCHEHGIAWRLSDMAELSPPNDTDNQTARLAARIGFELVGAMAAG